MTHLTLLCRRTENTRRSGFTLLETLIYVGITSLLLVSMVQVTMDVLSSRSRTQVQSEVQQGLRSALELLQVHLRGAARIDLRTSRFDDDDGVLVFVSSDPLGVETQREVFLGSGRLMLREGSGAAIPLTSVSLTVDRLRFGNRTPPRRNRGTVEIEVHVIENTPPALPRQREEATLRTVVSLRP